MCFTSFSLIIFHDFISFSYLLLGDVMKILAHGNNLYNPNEYDKMIQNNPDILGLSLDITMTKDNQIVIYSVVPNDNLTLEAIQSNTLSNLNTYQLVTLDRVLSYYQNGNKKIFLHLLPFAVPVLQEDTILYIQRKNKIYIEELKKVVWQYPNMNLYISSRNHTLIHSMKQMLSGVKIGVTLEESNLNYIDVDFYEFPTTMLDYSIMREQIHLKKEVVILLRDCSDITMIINSFRQYQSLMNDAFFQQLYFNTNYPQILSLVFRR